MGLSGSFALGIHFLFESFHFNGKARFPCHELGKVKWESVGVIQFECKGTGQLTSRMQTFDFPIKEFNSAIKGVVEGFLFGLKGFHDQILSLLKLREKGMHLINEGGGKQVKERLFETKSSTVTNASAKNSPENVVSITVSWKNSVCDRKTESSQVISYDSKGNVRFLLLIGRFAFRGESGFIRFAGKFAQFFEDWKKNVGVVIGGRL